MTTRTLTWQRLDLPGQATATLERTTAGWLLRGAATVDDVDTWRIDCDIACDHQWNTIHATLKRIHNDERLPPTEVWANPTTGTWEVNGQEQVALKDLNDIDLSFTPATNTITLRRLSLAVGEAAETTAAWLDFPSFEWRPLQQRYQRLDERTYRYQAPGLNFETVLEVDEDGFVVDYPGLWRANPVDRR